jgi:type VI protein secretion system component VasF
MTLAAEVPVLLLVVGLVLTLLLLFLGIGMSLWSGHLVETNGDLSKQNERIMRSECTLW